MTFSGSVKSLRITAQSIASEMEGRLFGKAGLHRVPGPDDVEDVSRVVEPVLPHPGRFGILRFEGDLVEQAGGTDLPAASGVLEIEGAGAGYADVEREVDGVFPEPRMLKHVVAPAGHPAKGVPEENGHARRLPPVAAAFLPAAVDADLVEGPGDAVPGFGDDVDELRVLAQQREGREAEPVVAPRTPVAAVGGRPPVILVVPADAGDGVLEQARPYPVPLLAVEGVVYLSRSRWRDRRRYRS